MPKQKTDWSSLTLEDRLPQSDLSVGDMVTRFRQAKDRREQLRALADLNLCKVDDIKACLLANGVSYKEFPRAPRKKAEPPDIKPEGEARLQAERDRPKPSGLHKPQTPPQPSPEPAQDKIQRVIRVLQELSEQQANLTARLEELNAAVTQISELVNARASVFITKD